MSRLDRKFLERIGLLFYLGAIGLVKRVFDVVLAVCGLTVLAPLFLIVSALIKFDSTGPIFYRGLRVGQFGKLFRIYKFRTMVEDAEVIGGPSTGFNDPRVTSVGAYLRKYKLDELPQLINVLNGEMSVVGPRPQVERYTKRYSGEETLILSVRPGITDYASIKFINLDRLLDEEGIDDKYLREVEPEKNRLRIEYVKNKSFRTDLKILFQTFIQLLKIRSLWSI